MGRRLNFWREKINKTTNQNPKFNYLGGPHWIKKSLKKIKANSACIHPSPTPFREGAHRKKVMSGFKKVSAE